MRISCLLIVLGEEFKVIPNLAYSGSLSLDSDWLKIQSVAATYDPMHIVGTKLILVTAPFFLNAMVW